MSTLVVNAVEPKRPGEAKFYTFNWAPGLNSGATVSTSTWTLAAGLTNASATIASNGLSTTVKISGGTAGLEYSCVNQVVTSDGETLEREGVLAVRV